jgi:hypothetical protein
VNVEQVRGEGQQRYVEQELAQPVTSGVMTFLAQLGSLVGAATVS